MKHGREGATDVVGWVGFVSGEQPDGFSTMPLYQLTTAPRLYDLHERANSLLPVLVGGREASCLEALKLEATDNDRLGVKSAR